MSIWFLCPNTLRFGNDFEARECSSDEKVFTHEKTRMRLRRKTQALCEIRRRSGWRTLGWLGRVSFAVLDATVQSGFNAKTQRGRAATKHSLSSMRWRRGPWRGGALVSTNLDCPSPR